MAEGLNQTENLENKRNMEFLPYFPTDIERAKSGLKKFNEALEKFPILRKVVEKDEHYRDTIRFVVMGLMPESGFYSGSGFKELANDEERRELKRIYEEGLGLKVLRWQRTAEKEKYDHSIFNPASVEKVIRNCPIPNLFPNEAKKDPMRWVLKNTLDWDDSIIPSNRARFSVLNGYPPKASSVFGEYAAAKEKFINAVLTDAEKKEYNEYATQDRHNRKLPEGVEVKLNEALKTGALSVKEVELIRNFFTHDGTLEYFGDGLFDEDEKYFENIKTLLEEIKIEYKPNPA